MIEFRPFKAEDAEILVPDAVDEDLRNVDPSIWRTAAELNESCGCCFTGFYKGRMTGAGGIRTKKNGTGRVWAVIRRIEEQNKVLRMIQAINVFDGMKLMFDILIKEYGFKKICSESRIGFEGSQRLLEHLGFEKMRRNMLNGKYYFFKRVQ